MTYARGAILLLAILACLGSSGSSKDRRQDPGPPGYGPQPGAGGYWCHNEQAASGLHSQCRPAYDACEQERQAAEADGLAVSGCAQVPQVACFQLGADPAPAAEWCAASLEDCEFWRQIDEQKNGSAGQRCAWRQ